jgi:hypothetical protein
VSTARRLAWLPVTAVALAATVLAIPGVYWLAVTVSPPLTPDGRHVMPLAQLGVAIVAGPLLGLVAGVLAARARRR